MTIIKIYQGQHVLIHKKVSHKTSSREVNIKYQDVTKPSLSLIGTLDWQINVDHCLLSLAVRQTDLITRVHFPYICVKVTYHL